MKTICKPFYQDNLTTIYHADALKLFPNLVADVLVTDPPYGMSYKSGWSERIIENDNDLNVRDEIIKNWRGPALIFGRWSEERPLGTHTRLIWDKKRPGMGDLSVPWGPSDEEIYVIGKGFKGRRRSNVVQFSPDKRNEHLHPTVKPINLMQHLIERCPPGVIIDPFMGSGSTLVAAKSLNRMSIGVELDISYCRIAAERLKQSYLFGELSP